MDQRLLLFILGKLQPAITLIDVALRVEGYSNAFGTREVDLLLLVLGFSIRMLRFIYLDLLSLFISL